MMSQDKSVPNHVAGLRHLSEQEEKLATLTHGLGCLAGVLAAVYILRVAWGTGDIWRVIASALYGLLLIAVYLFSTLSHAVIVTGPRELFRRMDQGVIYLFITATFTPFGLVYLRTPTWLVFLAAMWGLSIFGFVSKVFLAHRINATAVSLYLLLGWMPVVTAPSLMADVPGIALWWMLIGGIFYTVGTLFLVFDHKIYHFHAVWHLFVVAGSASHYYSIATYVIQPPVG